MIDGGGKKVRVNMCWSVLLYRKSIRNMPGEVRVNYLEGSG